MAKFPCKHCDREFSSKTTRAVHTAAKHEEDDEVPSPGRSTDGQAQTRPAEQRGASSAGAGKRKPAARAAEPAKEAEADSEADDGLEFLD